MEILLKVKAVSNCGQCELMKKTVKASSFTCPFCGHQIYPSNVHCITCGNCGASGNLQHFSAVVKEVA